jgi:hypothetical protein
VHTLHLVLPPGPEISNNLYAASDSALRYRNIPNPSPSRSPLLFTDPGDPNATRTGRDHTAANAGSQPPGQSSAVPPASGVNGSSIHSHTLAGAGHPSSEESLRQALEQHRRRAEELNMFVDRARALINSHTTRIITQGANLPRTDNIGQFPRPPPASHTTVAPGTTAQTNSANIHNPLNNGVSQTLLIARITAMIMLFELDLDRGRAPLIDSVAAVRTQLYAISDARYRQPSIGTGDVEGLILRLQNINARAYQIRQSEHMRRLYSTHTNRAGNTPQTTQSPEYYLITAPSGEQMMLTGPPPSPPQHFSLDTVPVFPDLPQAARGNELNALGVVPNNVMHNVVREAILNQQPVRGNGNDHFAQNLRRFWLFMRLFFFCYLFTDSGTWERFLFVGVAALVAFFSESNIIGRVFNMMVQPIQRHLEGLIHGEAAAPVPARQDNANANQPNQPRAPTGGAQQGLRRVERAVALFVASLIPGLGERQVEVRNAAEEAARNARQQEQARIDAANAQNDVPDQENPEPNQGEAAAPSSRESSGNANTQQPQQ